MVHATVPYAPAGAYLPTRPRLTVVERSGYSQMPRAVVFDNAISPGARLFYAGLQTYWWKSGECYASHATLAADFEISERQVQRYIAELVRAGHIVERKHGRGHAKAYGPARHDRPYQPDISVVSEPGNTTDLSPLDRNTTDLSTQHDRSVAGNTTDLSYISRPVEVDPPEEITKRERVAADAAPKPARSKPAPKKSRLPMTTCPDTFDLEQKHFDYAEGLGLPPARARAETEKFLAHHRFKGTRGQDWYAGWQNWMRRAVQYDVPQRPHRNGAVPPVERKRLPISERTY